MEESKQLYQQGLEAYLGGDVKKSEALWKKALELNPQNDDALKALTKLQEIRSQQKPE